jgi:Tol biopolymer transport system component
LTGQQNDASSAPDGSWIVLTANVTGSYQTHLMRQDGSALHQLFPAAGYEYSCCAHWAPTGRTLAVAIAAAGKAGSVAIVDVDENGAALGTRLLELPGRINQYPMWSPDGRLIAYESRDATSYDIWIADREGRQPRRLTSFAENERAAAWQARPLRVYFRRGFDEIWRIPLNDDGSPAGAAGLWMTLPGHSFEHGLDVSRDGTRILVTPVHLAADILLVELGARQSPGR